MEEIGATQHNFQILQSPNIQFPQCFKSFDFKLMTVSTECHSSSVTE